MIRAMNLEAKLVFLMLLSGKVADGHGRRPRSGIWIPYGWTKSYLYHPGCLPPTLSFTLTADAASRGSQSRTRAPRHIGSARSSPLRNGTCGNQSGLQ